LCVAGYCEVSKTGIGIGHEIVFEEFGFELSSRLREIMMQTPKQILSEVKNEILPKALFDILFISGGRFCYLTIISAI
jgi:hypothetical protein